IPDSRVEVPFGNLSSIVMSSIVTDCWVLATNFNKNVYTAITRIVQHLVFSPYSTLVLNYAGMKVVVTGDAIQRHEKTMVLMNHRTRLDWLYFFPYVFHARILNRQKIALKSMLKWIPGLGWAMQVAGYIFLDRQWEADQVHISNILSYFVELESKPNILFFAEGTDFNEGSKKRSKEYARKSGLTEFEYVLQPRTTGFTYFVNHLRNISGIHAVHDVTIAYPYEILHNELELIKAGAPRAVHFHIKRYSISELPEDQDELGKWCQNLWAEKEALLKEYYSE
uniref:Phospholipid/glycerol acyltransferase domain-containing protein n=1 Tax=Ciona intestinalis TaxID=7719 RepID=F6W804_CIOIN